MRYRFLRFPEGKTKGVTFSYDDGSRADIRLAQIFNKYDVKCTFNVCSSFLGQSETDTNLTKEEIQTHLLDKGHEIAVHGAYHRAPGNIRAIDGIQDVLNCRRSLEELFGCIIRGMAYPDSGITRFSNGASYENIKRYLTDLDIAYARTLGQDNNDFELPIDWYSWMPTAKHTNPQIFNYIDEFTGMDVNKMYISQRGPRLFYIWGHSFEFDRDNNWERIDSICEKLSGREDTWYATNMEIYEYVKAYDSLIYSVDSLQVYNPTLITVWFLVDDKLYCIKPGETLTI